MNVITIANGLATITNPIVITMVETDSECLTDSYVIPGNKVAEAVNIAMRQGDYWGYEHDGILNSINEHISHVIDDDLNVWFYWGNGKWEKIPTN